MVTTEIFIDEEDDDEEDKEEDKVVLVRFALMNKEGGFEVSLQKSFFHDGN